tara:strand:+ start:45 stop:203 length:159 start_codon:yes stop_codon:yes gene_type:complete
MGYANPDYYYHKIIMEQTEKISDLKIQIRRLEKKLIEKNLLEKIQLEKELTK